jgi:diguanylate cyclase (GGDEF)-like protein/PAS domain S-box-containing protein
MAGLIKQFVDQSLEAEISCRNMNNAYRALESSEGKFRQLAENINEVFIIFDFINKAVLYVSPAFEKIWGKPASLLFDDPYAWIENVHPDHRSHVESISKIAPKDDKIDYEYRIISKGGEIKWINDRIFSIRNDRGEVYRLARIIQDITDRKKSEDELTRLAYHDIITDIPNRRAFFEKFDELIKQANRNKMSVNIAVFYMDLDRFKYINDTLGQEIGDQVLKKISKRIKFSLRDSDYLYRIGGDEFSVVLNNITQDIDSGKVAQKLLTVVSKPIKIEDKDIFPGVSIGISVYPKDGNDASVLIKNSDIALQTAKKERNTYKFYNEEMNKKASDKIEIEKNLRYALEKEQFMLYYQPLVSFNGNIVGMEALIRWNHPELGFIPPDRFIPIAESTGQIMRIGDWTLQIACRQIKEWHEAGFDSLRVAVNLSAKQFLDDDLVQKIEAIIKETNISPASLELEITESSVMENPDEAIIKINQLYDKGISFSIDDFGTGYSSLSYLKKFKVNHLKVDRSFIKDIITDQSNTQITKAIIDMAHNLKMKVIAEGVETSEQRDFLTSIKCDIMQGYFFSRPVPAADFMKLLKIGDFR